MGQLSVAIVNYESAGSIGQLLGQLDDRDIDRAVIVDNQSSDDGPA